MTEQSNSMTVLAGLAEKQAELEYEMGVLEGEMKAKKVQHSKIADEMLPELMEELGLDKFETKSGLKIDVSEKVRASISKANQSKAFAWLEEHDHGGLIKSEVKVTMAKGDVETAYVAMDALNKCGLMPEAKYSVHPQTLGAWVREMLEEGEDIPLDILGVFRQRTAKVEVPK